jgi:hypothetical protein
MRYRVTCITKDDQQDRFHSITHLGVAIGENQESQVPLDDAIAKLEAGTWSLFIEQRRGDRVEVIVATDPASNAKYLQTEGDDPDKILTLSACGKL